MVVKFIDQKQVLLKGNVIYHGGAYFAGQFLSVDEATASKWIADGVAEASDSPAQKPAPKPATLKEKQDK